MYPWNIKFERGILIKQKLELKPDSTEISYTQRSPTTVKLVTNFYVFAHQCMNECKSNVTHTIQY